MNNRGFTLIEIIIALAIFAIIATITSSLLVQSVHLQERVSAHSERLSQIDLAIALLQQDIVQLIPRAVRGNEMHLFPPIIGQAKYFEFTRGGATNPMGIEKKSSLIRVAYVCEQHQLIRRIWQQLDTPDRSHYHDAILLKNLKNCSIEYLGLHNNLVSSWYQEPPQPHRPKPVFLPKAIKITIAFDQNQPIALSFAMPGALYG